VVYPETGFSDIFQRCLATFKQKRKEEKDFIEHVSQHTLMGQGNGGLICTNKQTYYSLAFVSLRFNFFPYEKAFYFTINAGMPLWQTGRQLEEGNSREALIRKAARGR